MSQNENWLTAKKERVSYGVYFMGQNAIYTFQYMFLATYLLMCGLDAIAISGVLIVVKIWDAVNDCLFGGLIDKIKFKKGGKFLPWLRISLPLIGIATLMLFGIPKKLGLNGRLIWFTAAYLLWDAAYTICDVPVFGLVTTMTDIQDERTSLMTTGRLFANIGVLVAMGMGYVLPTEAVGLSFTTMALLVVVFSMISMLFLCLWGKEHVIKPGTNQDSYTFRQMFQYLGHNKYLIIYYIGLLLFTGLNTASAVLQFTCFYLFDSALIATIIAALSFVPSVVVAFIMPALIKKFDKFRMFKFCALVYTIFSIIIWIVGPKIVPHIVLSIIRGFAFGGISVIQFMFTPDCAEYGQYKTGIEAKGITFAIQTFTEKIISAVSSSLGLAILGLFGWVSVSASSFAELAELNVAQSPSALNALWAVYALIPAVGSMAAMIVWSQYKLETKDVELMAKYNNGEITREECDTQLSRKY